MSFIEGYHGNPDSIKKQILILVKEKVKVNHYRIIVIEIDPWKRIDRKVPFNNPIVYKRFLGRITLQAKKDIDCDETRKFSPDKIRNAQFLQNIYSYNQQFQKIFGTVVIQFEHCIATTSLSRNGQKRLIVHSKLPQMVQSDLKRGLGDAVYFATVDPST